MSQVFWILIIYFKERKDITSLQVLREEISQKG